MSRHVPSLFSPVIQFSAKCPNVPSRDSDQFIVETPRVGYAELERKTK